MKIFLTTLITLLLTNQLVASTDEWTLKRANLHVENDVFANTDKSYSAGEALSLLYEVSDNTYDMYNYLGNEDKKTSSYIQFILSNQIYTPDNTNVSNLILTDRPYAGWSYLDTTIHKASKNELRSLSLKVGVVGPASLGEQIQNNYHRATGSRSTKGWDNQLKNELGINLKYTQKWRYSGTTNSDMQWSVVPFASAELGNIAINAKAGVSARFGWNIQKDYGFSSLDLGADNGVPVHGESLNQGDWGFSLNIIAAGSAVGRDIFLDGNTFKNSHSVDKKSLVGHYGFGATLRYKNVILDVMEINNTKQFDIEPGSHKIHSFLLSYLY